MGERLDVGARGRCGLGGLAGEFGFGVGEFAQLGFPARLQAARDEPVVGVALVEGAFGARGVVAGPLDAQLDRAGRSRAPVGDRVGGLERERDLLGRDGSQQPLGDGPFDHRAHHAATARRAGAVGAGVAAVVAAVGAAVQATGSLWGGGPPGKPGRTR